MSDYPVDRPAYYAHRLTRLLFKSCATQSMGHHAAMLVIHIAHTEDAARYRGPVTFWNSQLSETMGFKSPKQLNNARQAAIDSGWLVYERNHDRSVGKYWTRIPPTVERFNDEPIEENTFHSENGTGSGIENGTRNGKHSENGTRNGTGSGTRSGTGSGKPPNPVPVPDPIHAAHVLAFEQKDQDPGFELQTTPKTKPKRPRDQYSAEFVEWWPHYPRHVSKQDAEQVFPAALSAIMRERAVSREEALQWLIARTIDYAKSVEDTPADKIKHPNGWLSKKRFNDDLLTINRSSSSQTTSWSETDRIPRATRKAVAR